MLLTRFFFICLLLQPCLCDIKNFFALLKETDPEEKYNCLDDPEPLKNIELIMLAFTPKRFLFMSKDAHFVDVPRTQLAEVGQILHKMVVAKETKPISETHPDIHGSKHMEPLKNEEISVVSLFDKEDEYVDFARLHTEPGSTAAMIVLLDQLKSEPGLIFWDNRDKAFVSTDMEPLVFYAVYKEDSKLELAKYKLTTETMAEYVQKAHEKSLSDEERKQLLDLDGKARKICKTDKEDEVVLYELDHEGDCTPQDWAIKYGFVHANFFALFEEEAVITFSADAFNKPGEQIHFDKIPFDEFFKCSQEDVQKLSMGDSFSREFPGSFPKVFLVIFLVFTSSNSAQVYSFHFLQDLLFFRRCHGVGRCFCLRLQSNDEEEWLQSQSSQIEQIGSKFRCCDQQFENQCNHPDAQSHYWKDDVNLENTSVQIAKQEKTFEEK